MKEVVAAYRNAIKFIERFFRNVMVQARWVTRKSMWLYGIIMSWHVSRSGSPAHGALKCAVGMSIVILVTIPLFCLLFLWAFAKSL